MFVDHGREMPNGQPALLKRRDTCAAMMRSLAGGSYCSWAGQPLTLPGVLRLSRDPLAFDVAIG